MKTVVDAVNELKADISSGKYTTLAREYGHISFDGVDWMSCSRTHPQEVCSVNEFDQCVAEMEVWHPDLHGGDTETVTVDGMVYGIGKVYEFSNDEAFWRSGTLTCAREEGKYRFDSESAAWDLCREIDPKTIGTITPAPAELVDGKVYMFEFDGHKFVGFYNQGSERFEFSSCGVHINESDATNITPLSPEAK